MTMTKKTTVPTWVRILIPVVLIVAWLGAAGLGGPYFGKISEVSSTDLATFLPKSAESTKVNDILNTFRDNKTIPAIVVFHHDDQVLTTTETASLTSVVASLQQIDGVEGTISPAIVSDDGKAAIVVVPLKSDGDFKQIFPAVRTQLTDAKLTMSSKLSGPASMAHDLQGAFSGIDGTLLWVALTVVFIILLAVYRSPFLPVIVLTTAMGALSAAIYIVWHLAKAGTVQLNGQVQGILFILVIGAATDYSLLYIARYREELTHHQSAWRAIIAALKGSWEPIVAAGGTVTVGLLCLLLSDLGSNKALGPVGGIGIITAIAAALTFLPALLLVCGRGVFWPRRPQVSVQKSHDEYQKNHPMWAKIGQFVQRHPRRIWVSCTVLLLVAGCGIFQLKAEGVAQSNLILGYSEARDGQAIINVHFPGGFGSPAYIVTSQANQSQVVSIIEATSGVDSVSITTTDSSAMPLGKAETKLKQTIMTKVESARTAQLATVRAKIESQMVGYPAAAIDQAYATAIAQIPSAETLAANAYPFKNAQAKVVNNQILLQVTLTDASDSLAARQTVVRLRDALKSVEGGVLVGGISAMQYDTNQTSTRDEIVIIPVILLAITIILTVLLRSIVAPLVLLLTTIISFTATLGVSAFLFNNVWHFVGADPAVVIFGFVFLVALGIDYNIFLMTRVREETILSGVRRGTIKGLVVTGGVITSAGIVLAATFAALGVIPILFLAEMAFIVAFGVLLDTIIVRSLLVPALTLEIGRLMWWPSKISRK